MFYFSFVLLLSDPTPAAGRIFWHKKLHFRMVSWPGNHFLGRGLKSLYSTESQIVQRNYSMYCKLIGRKLSLYIYGDFGLNTKDTQFRCTALIVLFFIVV